MDTDIWIPHSFHVSWSIFLLYIFFPNHEKCKNHIFTCRLCWYKDRQWVRFGPRAVVLPSKLYFCILKTQATWKMQWNRTWLLWIHPKAIRNHTMWAVSVKLRLGISLSPLNEQSNKTHVLSASTIVSLVLGLKVRSWSLTTGNIEYLVLKGL